MLRWAVPSDAARLAEVHTRSWQDAYRGILPQEFLDSLSVERREAWWREKLEEGRKAHVLDHDGIVGFCHAEASEAEDGWGEVYAIYLHPDAWGRGHGHTLLQAGLEYLKDSGFERALLWVLEDNFRARGFYESEGWDLSRRFQILEIGGAQVTEVRYEIGL